MITKRDQDSLLKLIDGLEQIIMTDESTIRMAYQISKEEAVQNNINNIKHVIADLR